MIWQSKIMIGLVAILISAAGVTYPTRGTENASCIDIASDSNGVGQVLVQIPTTSVIGIVYTYSLQNILQSELQNLNLKNIQVIDRSLTAAGLTFSGRTYYPKTRQFEHLLSDGCEFIMVGPYLADNRADPQQYMKQMKQMLGQIATANPKATIFLLSWYQPFPASYVTSDIEYLGFKADHIKALNDALLSACRSNNLLGQLKQLRCIETQPLFAGLGDSYVLTQISRDTYMALVIKNSAFTSEISDFYTEHPDGMLIGDGYHLSLVGRKRLMKHIAQLIKDEMGSF